MSRVAVYNVDMKPKIYAIRINEDMIEQRVFERLRTIANKRKRPIAFLVREALVEYLEREEGGRRRFPWKR